MRIAVCYNNPYGGAGRAIYETSIRLAVNHSVSLFTPSPRGRGLPELESLDPRRPSEYAGFPSIPRPFGRVSSLTSLIELWLLSRAYRVIANIVNREFDLAFVHSCPYTSAPILLRQLRIPTVWYTGEPLRHLHEPSVERPHKRGRMLGPISLWLDRHDPLIKMRNRVIERIEKHSAQSASSVLTYSYYSREVLWHVYGIDARVVRLGIDTELYRPVPIEQERMVLSVGHVSPLKGHDFVIEAIGTIPSSLRPKLVVAGDTSQVLEREYLEEMARRKRVHLVFERSATQAAIVSRYCRAAVVAFAPVMEPFGLVPLEAMSCGVPVVGVREGGLRETIVEGYGGYLVDRNPQAFGERILTLLRDDTLRKDQGRRGREYVIENWAWEQSINKLQSVLAEILGSPTHVR